MPNKMNGKSTEPESLTWTHRIRARVGRPNNPRQLASRPQRARLQQRGHGLRI